MKRRSGIIAAAGILFVGLISSRAAVEAAAILQVDSEFVKAVAASNPAALGKLLDADFTWTDAQGNTLARNEVLATVPKNDLDDEASLDRSERTYGAIAAVSASRGKTHVLRLWVRRSSGWRLLVYHAVTQLQQPSASQGSGVNTCENPCKAVPFEPSNQAERAIILSWQALESAVTAHNAAAWGPHIADEFVQISSSSDHPISKQDRMATLDKQKVSGLGSAPAPLVSAKMLDFGDAVVMTCRHQPYQGKPIHVSRLWIKRDGNWVMAISYQTTMQPGTAK
jgi:hypothetical protein